MAVSYGGRRSSRFRRELANKDGRKEIASDNDAFGSGLGHKLATFKTCPDPDLEQEFNLLRCRPLFIGACALCTTFSNATFISTSVHNFAAVKNCLEERGCVASSSKASSVAFIDFSRGFQGSHYIQQLQQTYEKSREKIEEYTSKQNIRQEPAAGKTWLQRLAGWLEQKILMLLFPSGVFCHPGQLEVLERCAKSKAPFLFVTTHKSQLDLLLVKAALSQSSERHDLKAFAATRSSDLKLVPGFDFLDDKEWTNCDMAWAIQQETICSIFKAKCHILTFLEACEDNRPDLDFDANVLDHALQCIYDQAVDDIQIVPVGISYDLGRSKRPVAWPQGFLQCLKVFLGIWSPHKGRVRVDFDQPFSLKEFEEKWRHKIELKKVEHCQLDTVDQCIKVALARHSLFYSWATCRFMLSDLLAFSRRFPEGDTIDQLIDDVRLRKGHLGFVERDEDLGQPVIASFDPILMTRLYGRESITIAALLSLLQQPLNAYVATNANATVKLDELVDRSLVAFDLLSYEDHFILPCKDTRDSVDETLQWLKQQEIICIKEPRRSEHCQENWARRMASHIEKELAFDEDSDEADNRYQIQEEVVLHVSLKPELVKRMAFLYKLIKPTLLAYYKVVDFLEEVRTAQQHFQLKKVATDLEQPFEQVKRIFAKLKSWQVMSHCQLHPECYQLQCDTDLTMLVISVKEFVM